MLFRSTEISGSPYVAESVITGVGSLVSESAVISGSGAIGHVGTGALSSEVSTISGSGIKKIGRASCRERV